MLRENHLRSEIHNTLGGRFALEQVGERVLLVNAAWRALQDNPEQAEKDFSPFIMSIARSPECAWLDYSFMHLPGIDKDGNLSLIGKPPATALPKKD